MNPRSQEAKDPSGEPHGADPRKARPGDVPERLTGAGAPLREGVPAVPSDSAANGRGLREHPLLCKAPMVRAILAGRKTQTRRVIKPEWLRCLDPDDPDDLTKVIAWCPFGGPGDRLWVKETWYCDHNAAGDFDATKRSYVGRQLTNPECIAEWRGIPRPAEHIPEGNHMYYRADGEAHQQFEQLELPFSWNSPLFMPRWASRIALEITEVRVQPVQAICHEDARAEGLTPISRDGGQTFVYGVPGWDNWLDEDWDPDPRVAFLTLWNKINAKRKGCDWNGNPWCWALSFRVLP